MPSDSKTSGSNPKEIYIGLIGVTGAGKTTFTCKASGRTDLKIGNSLKSCMEPSPSLFFPPFNLSLWQKLIPLGTQQPQVVRFLLDGVMVVLVDTPGFDDDHRSDVHILKLIADWLSSQSEEKQQRLLDGLILLHPITANRIGGTERRRTRLLEAILGKKACKRIVIATTMWDDLKNPNDKFAYRMEGRLEKGEVWHDMVSNGATVVRHQNSRQSAHDIIRIILEKSRTEKGGVRLQLQEELESSKGHMGNTTVGRETKKTIQDDIERLNLELRQLEKSPPPERSKERKQWKKDKRELKRDIKKRQEQLAMLESMFVVSALFKQIQSVNISICTSPLPPFISPRHHHFF